MLCCSGSYEEEDEESCCSGSYEEEDKEGSEEYLSRDFARDNLEEQQENGQGWQSNLQGTPQHCGKHHSDMFTACHWLCLDSLSNSMFLIQ